MSYNKDAKDIPSDGSAAQSAISDPGANIDEWFPSTGAQYGSVEPHIFTNGARAEHWRNIYETAKYECRHRFDPSFQWTARSEVLVKRKVITKNRPPLPLLSS